MQLRKQYRAPILVYSALVAFLIATTGIFALSPPLARATEPVLCSGGTITRATPNRRQPAFQYTKNATATALNPFALIGAAFAVYFPPSLLVIFLVHLFYIEPKYRYINGT